VATLTLTGERIDILQELGSALSQAAATCGPDNRLAGTFTLVDTGSPPNATYVITATSVNGTTNTFKVG
jgi:hypothetical protein